MCQKSTDETKTHLNQYDVKAWRRRETPHEQKYNTSSVKHGGCRVMGTGHWCLLLIEVAQSTRMNYKVYRAILSA